MKNIHFSMIEVREDDLNKWSKKQQFLTEISHDLKKALHEYTFEAIILQVIEDIITGGGGGEKKEEST